MVCFITTIRCSVIDKLQEVADIDLIACLNVLDRCADPHQIMADIHATLSDDGRAIVALVLPYSHYVESSKFCVAGAAVGKDSNTYLCSICRRHVAYATTIAAAALAQYDPVAVLRRRSDVLLRTAGVDGLCH